VSRVTARTHRWPPSSSESPTARPGSHTTSSLATPT
jgi:hypothetical protein